jgi:hypothetical protein
MTNVARRSGVSSMAKSRKKSPMGLMSEAAKKAGRGVGRAVTGSGR